MVRLSGLPAAGPFGALQFLTRLPIRLRRAPDMAAMVVWFPVAGAVIGAIVGGVAAGMWELSTPVVAGAVAVVAGLLVTGAFHEDGLADVADAFGGGYTVERRMEILKDPRHGTYGVAAMCASIVVRVAAVGSLPGPAVMFASCVAAHVMARAVAVGLMAGVPLATHSGLGADYGRSTTPARAAVALVAGTAIVAAAVGWWVAPVLGVALVCAATVGALARHKIGGISGDVLGTCEQVAECACLVTLAALAAHHPVWWR